MDLSNLIVFATAQAAETAQHETSGGVIGTLGLNWKLFLAQVVNFGVVVFVLWKWVFKPVAGALESRRVKIEQSVKNAEEVQKKLEETQAASAQTLGQARQQAELILKKTQEQAGEMNREATEKTRRDAEKIMSDAKSTIAAEKDKALAEAREELANLVVMAAERVIKTKLDEKQDKKLIADVLQNFK